MTAHDVVARVRKILKVKQVGHAGTLDPMATGVLPIAVGSCCRLLSYLAGDKTYIAGILLGKRTTTDDIEGEVIEESGVIPDADKVTSLLMSFVGDSQQIPPNYSAVHHQGKRLYELARAGKLPDDIKARPVTIHAIEILACAPPVVRARIACGAGTYIRSIARDLGDALGTGGCLQSLQRVQSGPFEIKNSISLEELAKLSQDNLLDTAVIRAESVLGLPSINVDEATAHKLSNGQILPPETCRQIGQQSSPLLLITCNDKLVALCRRIDGDKLKPEVVVANAK